MADVRLTAVNPDDSQVYPVACNDKGELVLESATDLDVAVRLEVANTTYADGTGLFVGYGPDDFRNRTIRLNKDGGAQYDGVVQTGGLVTYKRTGVADQNIALFNSDVGGTQSAKFKLTADGSADFAGNITAGPYDSSANDATGAIIHSGGYIGVQRESTRGDATVFTIAQGVTEKINFRSGGSCTFAGGKVFIDLGGGLYLGNPPLDQPPYTNRNISLNNNGTASFSGNVTAPNITFKLSPATATTMPAPLIDEGFAANDEVNLLSELIKMKLQIRDLNAFMQRTLQDENETTQ